MRSLSRELILPALRLQVPDRPAPEHLAALTDLSADAWTTRPVDWTTASVVRLAVAEVLAARHAQAGPERGLPADPAEVTLAQVAGLFRPHVDLAGQSFRVAVVEAVNAGVPAVVDPLRGGLRQLGVTGRDPLWMLALGLDKVPQRARASFWSSVKGSVGVTAVIDALSSDGRPGAAPPDVSGLDPSELARADALLQAGGRTLAVAFDRPREAGASWLQVPVTLTRPLPWRGAELPRAQGGVVVSLRGEGWVEVHDTALSAVGAGMAGIDLGGVPRGRAGGLAAVVADRLAAARGRTLADVLESLRAVHPRVLETYGEQVRTEVVRVAIAAVDEDALVQLWLPTSALAGPLVTGAVDLVLGGADVSRGGRPERPERGRPDRGRPGQGRPERGRGEGGRPQAGGAPKKAGGRRGQQSRGRGPKPPMTTEVTTEVTSEVTTGGTPQGTTDAAPPPPEADRTAASESVPTPEPAPQPQAADPPQ